MRSAAPPAESICFFSTDSGDRWVDEDAPLDLPPYARSGADAEAQARRFTEAGGTGVVLRFGLFYGPRSERPPVLARTGYASSIHTDDAAAAVVAALDAPAGTYNIVDDEPLPRAEYAAAARAALGVRIRLLPAAVLAAMGSRATVAVRSVRASNRRFREATGWSPRYRSVREDFAAVAAAGEDTSSSRAHASLLRTLLGVLALSSLGVGLWAEASPRSFYDTFPGFGRQWVAVDGPFNEHLLRDVGALELALATVLAVAVVSLAPVVVRTAAAAALVFATPHLLYHLAHLDVLPAGDQVANVAVLALAVFLPLTALALSRDRGQRTLWRASTAMPAASVVMNRSPR
ncbi:MAG TPA: hypothetical protein VF112_08395 [Candidatus Dormibacteraeota bacterium]